MKAGVFFGPGDVRCVDIDTPAVAEPHEMLVKVEATSICGSDLHLFRGTLEHIMVPGRSQTGHELIGRVVDAGGGVRGFGVGDRVTVAYSCSCGRCTMCRLGQTAHCEATNKAVYGFGLPFGDLNGTHAQYMLVPHADGHAMQVPAGVSDAAAVTLSCNLPTALIANQLVSIEPGETVAIVGCGPTGLLALEIAMQRGPGLVVALDRVEYRLQRARAQGAVPVDVGADVYRQVALDTVHGRGFDKVIEAVGAPEALHTALALVRPGGVVAAVGVYCDESFELNLSDVFLRDITLHMNGFANVQPQMWSCLRMLEAGVVHPERLFTHEFSLDRIGKAFQTFNDKTDDVLKVLVRPDDSAGVG